METYKANTPTNPIEAYHPLLTKLLPAHIIKISQEYSISQYLLMFALMAVAMGFSLMVYIGILRIIS